MGEYRLTDVSRATVNGRACKIFKAYRYAGTHYEYVGQFSALTKAGRAAMIKIVETATTGA